MKHLIICLLAVFLTACSDSKGSNPTHETSGDFTPLIQMTKYEMTNIEELKEYDFEYITYGEMKEEPVEDWLFDMDKHVMDDEDVVGYDFSFYDFDEETYKHTNMSMDDFASFLGWVFNLKDSFDTEIIDEDDNSYDAKFTVSTNENDYIVYYSAERFSESEDYGVNECEIWLTY